MEDSKRIRASKVLVIIEGDDGRRLAIHVPDVESVTYSIEDEYDSAFGDYTPLIGFSPRQREVSMKFEIVPRPGRDGVWATSYVSEKDK